MIITLHEEGYSFNKIAKRTGIPKSTCFSIVKRDKQHREASAKTPYTKNAARSGRPLKLSSRERHFLIWTACRCRRTALNQLIKILPKSITINTARSYLSRAGIHRRRARRKSFLKKVHMDRRLSWCKERRHWSLED
ncbi:hypothetical protein P167DRAFT_496233 [Morchella conica CCBAS932]|uniref:Transposase Tc1-like domain-containing protein n=1 Tax=Morchella conica CCBAS932 TaxID=1392247 RepID=A0A3N4KCB6_9PEZI|nr:hypothetical protein P167DRAFT_496233 [Morchella conica CCBAS932]